MSRPYLFVLTPVRNEAWILPAFLQATSQWADYIIIADQNSTDGSREIALQYPKVILIDNDNPEFNEAERQSLLINKAREIEGDKILFALDADEVFSANFNSTKDWQIILHSNPGDVFWFRWANLHPDLQHYWPSETYFPWVFHDDGIEPHGNYVRNMHSMRIPYPIEERQMYYVNDFAVLHFAYILPERVAAKMRFYKFIDFQMNHRNAITLSRTYKYSSLPTNMNDLPRKYLEFGFDLLSLIKWEIQYFWFDSYIIEHIKNYNNQEIAKLDIWKKTLPQQLKIYDHRTWYIRIVHYYLKQTQNYSNLLLIKLIDKLLKKVFIF